MWALAVLQRAVCETISPPWCDDPMVAKGFGHW